MPRLYGAANPNYKDGLDSINRQAAEGFFNGAMRQRAGLLGDQLLAGRSAGMTPDDMRLAIWSLQCRGLWDECLERAKRREA